MAVVDFISRSILTDNVHIGPSNRIGFEFGFQSTLPRSDCFQRPGSDY